MKKAALTLAVLAGLLALLRYGRPAASPQPVSAEPAPAPVAAPAPPPPRKAAAPAPEPVRGAELRKPGEAFGGTAPDRE